MTTEIIKSENIQLITTTIPEAYAANTASVERCLAVGDTILEEIEQGGMTDELDQRAAIYIERARKTVAKMYEKRSPITRIFDEVRAVYTRMEAAVDPSKKDSVPARIQAYRNEYAAQKREEEERKRREFIIQQQRTQAIAKYRQDVTDEYKKLLNTHVVNQLNTLTALYNAITLENAKESEDAINNFSDKLDEAAFAAIPSMVMLPANVNTEELSSIRKAVIGELLPRLAEQYEGEIIDRKLELSTRIPSKVAELQRAAKASAEEAQRIKENMAQQEAEEAARREAERMEAQRKEEAERALKAEQQQMGSLFDNAAATVQGYTPNAKVKKRINLLNAEGILPIISMWWSEEGCKLSIEELSKMFRKQIAYAEKLANDKAAPRFIQDESIEYTDQVTAR